MGAGPRSAAFPSVPSEPTSPSCSRRDMVVATTGRKETAMADGYTIKHRDEFESMEGSGDSTWRLARKALGTSAFGFNLVEIDPGGQIPEHDETGSGQVELYAILEGEAVL